MAYRDLPIRPNLRQLRQQAKDLRRDFNAGKSEAVSLVMEYGDVDPVPDPLILADAQRAIAKSYGIRNWQRLVLACRMADSAGRGCECPSERGRRRLRRAHCAIWLCGVAAGEDWLQERCGIRAVASGQWGRHDDSRFIAQATKVCAGREHA